MLCWIQDPDKVPTFPFDDLSLRSLLICNILPPFFVRFLLKQLGLGSLSYTLYYALDLATALSLSKLFI